MARPAVSAMLFLGSLAFLAFASADPGLQVNAHWSAPEDDGGRKLLANITGCVEATNNCQFTGFGLSLAIEQNALKDVSSGWFSVLPGETTEDLCIIGVDTQPRVWVYTKDLSSGSFCPPVEGDDMPPGFLDSKEFCLHGEEPHEVVSELGVFTDEESGETASSCEGLGSCYGEVTYYEIELPSSWSLPCING